MHKIHGFSKKNYSYIRGYVEEPRKLVFSRGLQILKTVWIRMWDKVTLKAMKNRARMIIRGKKMAQRKFDS